MSERPKLTEAMANETLFDHHLPPVFSYREAYFLGAQDQANLDMVYDALSGNCCNKATDTPENIKKAAKELAKEVAPIYKALKWDWHGDGIPTEEAIYNELLNLYKQLIEDEAEWIKSGGLTVSWRGEDCKDIFTLSFGAEKEVEAY